MGPQPTRASPGPGRSPTPAPGLELARPGEAPSGSPGPAPPLRLRALGAAPEPRGPPRRGAQSQRTPPTRPRDPGPAPRLGPAPRPLRLRAARGSGPLGGRRAQRPAAPGDVGTPARGHRSRGRTGPPASPGTESRGARRRDPWKRAGSWAPAGSRRAATCCWRCWRGGRTCAEVGARPSGCAWEGGPRGDLEVLAPLPAWPRKLREPGIAGRTGCQGPSTARPCLSPWSCAVGRLVVALVLLGPGSALGPRTDFGHPLPDGESVQRANVGPSDHGEEGPHEGCWCPDRSPFPGEESQMKGPAWSCVLAVEGPQLGFRGPHAQAPAVLAHSGQSSYRQALSLRVAAASLPPPWRSRTGAVRCRLPSRRDPQDWEGGGPGVGAGGGGRWERGCIQAEGSHPAPAYLFIFRRFLGGAATGAGRKRWEGRERGREGRGLGAPRRARFCWAPPALTVGDPAKAGVAMQRKTRAAGASREREGRGGSGFCRPRAPGVARSGRCPGRGAESAPRRPVQPPAGAGGPRRPAIASPDGGPGWAAYSPGSAPRAAVLSDAGPCPSRVSWAVGGRLIHFLSAWSRGRALSGPSTPCRAGLGLEGCPAAR